MINSKKDYRFYCDEDTKALFFGKSPTFIEQIKNPIFRYEKQLSAYAAQKVQLDRR